VTERTSYHQILRSSSIIGGASVINVLISLLRIKVVAVVLGPAGVGLVGLFQNLIATAATASALGFGTVGTRQIAEAVGQDDAPAVAAARRALFWGTLVLALVGAVVFWLLRDSVAVHVLGDAGLADEVGWLAVGVGLTVAAGSQAALLTGMRRIGDIARLSVVSAVLSTVLGLGALWLWGTQGLIVFVVAVPLASFLCGHWYVARLPKVPLARTPLPQLFGQWRVMVRLGSAFMVAGVMGSLGYLLVRTLVQRELGLEALGHFQAAWAISMTYLGFVLGAMGTDYYPRLTASIHDHAATNRLVNEQTEVALLLAGPVLVAMLALAPWVIRLLYTAEFAEAASILRWQLLGDVLKIASWPLGFILLASGAGKAFMFSETLAIAVFVLLVWLGLPLLGVQATGLAFVGMYVCYLPLVYWLARRRTRFVWTGGVARLALLLVFTALAVCLLAHWREWVGVAVGLAATVVFGIHGLTRLGSMIGPEGRLGRVIAGGNKLVEGLKVWK